MFISGLGLSPQMQLSFFVSRMIREMKGVKLRDSLSEGFGNEWWDALFDSPPKKNYPPWN